MQKKNKANPDHTPSRGHAVEKKGSAGWVLRLLQSLPSLTHFSGPSPRHTEAALAASWSAPREAGEYRVYSTLYLPLFELLALGVGILNLTQVE